MPTEISGLFVILATIAMVLSHMHIIARKTKVVIKDVKAIMKELEERAGRKRKSSQNERTRPKKCFNESS